MSDLNGIIAVVAGASRGAGRGIAIELAKAGAHVIITGRSLGDYSTTSDQTLTLDYTVKLIEEQEGSVRPIQCDHFKSDQVKGLFDDIKNEEGKIDLLVNNVWAGYQDNQGHLDISSEPFVNYFWKQPSWRWDNMFNSVKAHFLTAKFAVPLMLERKKGMIISTTFWDDDKIISNLPYDVSKNAIHRMIKAMDCELQEFGIYVYAISLGWIRTEKIKEMYDIDDFTYTNIPELEKTESVFYVGKVITNLIKDPKKEKKSGKIWKTGRLALEYNVLDVDGTQPKPYIFDRKIIDDMLEKMDPV